MSLQDLKKEVRMKLIFCIQIKVKASYKLISTLWASKFPTRWYKHYWCALPSILKVTSYKFCNFFKISKKEVRDGVHFLYADKHQSFYKVAFSFLMEVVRHVQSTQGTFIGIQDIQIFYRGPTVVLVVCSHHIWSFFWWLYMVY